MKELFTSNSRWGMILWAVSLLYFGRTNATELNGTYTIDSSQLATTTNFRNLSSAITFLTSANPRSDGGPSNSAPFGVNGPVTFNFAAATGPYTDAVIIPNIPGASTANPITINGNGNTLQVNCDASNYSVIRLQGAKYVAIQNLVIKTTNVGYGWGIHFYQNADSNTISNCTIDMSAVTTTTAARSAGIVFSNSLTTPTTTGANGKGNVIRNNLITGITGTGGVYYGITLCPQSAGTTLSANQIINNTIENFYSYGIYMANTNGSLVKGNVIRNTSKTSTTTIYGIYTSSTSLRDTIDGNSIYTPFGTPTSGSSFYGFYISSSTSLGNDMMIINNRIYDVRSNGPVYGMYLSAASNVHVYHNTISIDHAASTSTSIAYGAYCTGTPSGAGLRFKNNIVSVSRGGTAFKYGVYFATTNTLHAFDNNVYYVNGMNAFTGFFMQNQALLSDWKTVVGPLIDANTLFIDPNFYNSQAGNLLSKEGFINNKGVNLGTAAPLDFGGNPRSATPDPGAYEFSYYTANDAGIGEVVRPAYPMPAGSNDIYVKVRNSGSSTLTSATVNWKVNGVLQTPYSWTGSVLPGELSPNVLIGTITATVGSGNAIQAWTSIPNSVADSIATNDTGSVQNIYCVLPAGSYTVDRTAAASATNFTSFGNMAGALTYGGTSGAVTIDVVANTGPYTEQVMIGQVKGINALNKLTINGNNNTLQFNNTDAQNLHILCLNGTDHLVLNNLSVRSLNASYGMGIVLTARADSNVIRNCYIDISSVTGSSASAGITLTNALNTPTSTNTVTGNGLANTFEKNTITGNATGGPYYGIVVAPASSTNPTYAHTVVKDNIISDFTFYGIYMNYTGYSIIRNNRISRPTRSSTGSTYGMYFINGSQADTIELNVITDLCGGIKTNTSAIYGMGFATPNVNVAKPLIIRNNLMYNFNSAGTQYGIYMNAGSNIRMYHNTIVMDDPQIQSSTTYYTYGFYSTGTPANIHFQNNIVAITRAGTSDKWALYFATTGTGYTSNNNNLYVNGASNTYTGYYNAANYLTLTDWKAANSSAYDQASQAANPSFRTYLGTGILLPANDTMNNIGANLTAQVPYDFSGALRTTTPDPGAFEFSVPANDAAVSRLVSPANPISLGYHDVELMIKNYGLSQLSNATLNWEIDGSAQPSYPWSGLLNNNDSAQVIVGGYTFTTNGFYNLKAWTSSPNSQVDSFTLNDTINVLLCTPLNGSLTIDPSLPASSTNYTSFKSLLEVLQTCGLSGPLNVDVAAGTFVESIQITGNIPGISDSNRLVFNGAGRASTVITHNASPQRATVLLNGAKHITFQNMTIESTGLSSGFGVLFTNAADSNIFFNCHIKVLLLTTGNSSFAPVVMSGSTTALNTAGNNGSMNHIDSCTLTGGYYSATLYNSTAQKAVGNRITRCEIANTYYYGVYAYYQNQLEVSQNSFTGVGNGYNTFSAAIYVNACDSGIRITKNAIRDGLGGYGIYLSQNLGNSSSHNLIANNMIQYGAGTNTTYGIYDGGNAWTDIAHNTVNNTSADGTYVSTCIYLNYNNVANNNLTVQNNIFVASAGALTTYYGSTALLGSSSITVSHNVYYSPLVYPWRITGFIYSTLTGYKNALIAAGIINADTGSLLYNPAFFSATNLRTISPAIDSIGIVLPHVPDDIDGNPRSLNAPDPGVSEFNKAADDAGVTSIVTPGKPLQPGLSDIKVMIKNFGTSVLSQVDVHYEIDAGVQTFTYFGSLAPGAEDSVVFNDVSGPGGTSQQYLFAGNLVTVKAWTTNPNNTPDPQGLNDTSSVTLCGGLSGSYTIDPAGSGPANFVSFNEAIDKMNCGGVYGPVVFDIANGTYTGQIDLVNIPGSSPANTIVFRSASGVASSVVLTSSASAAASNFTVRFLGASNIRFEGVTINNTNTSFGRLISINKLGATNTNTSNIEIRNCILEGVNTTSTGDALALVYGPTGDNAINISFVNNQFRYGSYGVYLGGQNIINLYSDGLVVDSNYFFGQYWSGIYLINRRGSKIRNNVLDAHPSYGYYSLYMSGISGLTDITGNTIQNTFGYYGMNLNTSGYYGEVGICNVSNNVINMSSTANAQYGLYISNSSLMNIHSNTVRCASSSTSNYAFYFSGNTISAPTPQIVQSNGISTLNNIFHANSGYAIYLANIYSVTAFSFLNYNVYYSSSPSFAYVNGANYAPANFFTYINSLGSGNDTKSRFGSVTFTSATNLKPVENNSSVWLVNGRAVQNFDVQTDKDGVARSFSIPTGVPDIGAYEVIPTVKSLPLVLTDSIDYGVTQKIVDGIDTVGYITWAFSGTLPTAVTARYMPGTLVSSPALYNTGANEHKMDVLWELDMSGGAAYIYDLKLKYDPFHLGTVPYESDIRFAYRDAAPGSWWTPVPGVGTTIDTVEKTFMATYLYSGYHYTGTSDILPLPVKLDQFTAQRSGKDAWLKWTTASEKNSLKFEVERAEPGKPFVRAGTVNAAGSSASRRSYDFTDINVANNISGKTAYYRLKMIDRDGSFEYSATRTVYFGEPGSVKELNAYPNPFSNVVMIDLFSSTASRNAITVCDIYGRALTTINVDLIKGDNKLSLDQLSALPSGVYILKTVVDGTAYTRKLVKE